jgi:hypothetical protein
MGLDSLCFVQGKRIFPSSRTAKTRLPDFFRGRETRQLSVLSLAWGETDKETALREVNQRL